MQFDFLICSERSGSNLITKMMDAHPIVCGPFPTMLMGVFVPNLYRYGNLSEDSNWHVLLEDVVNYTTNIHSKWITQVSVEMLAASVPSRDFGDIIRVIYEYEAKANCKQQVFVKENHAYKFNSFIENYFEHPRYIWVVRDPRDMAFNMKETAVMSGGADAAAHIWKHDQSKTLNVYNCLKNTGRIHLVKFEDLLSRPKDILQDICAFLNIDYSPVMLDFHKKDIVKTNAGNVSAWADLAKPLMQDNFGFYKSKLSETEIRYIEAICKHEMDFLGYKRDYDDSVSIDELKKSMPPKKAEPMSEDEKSIFKRYFEAKEVIYSRELFKKHRNYEYA